MSSPSWSTIRIGPTSPPCRSPLLFAPLSRGRLPLAELLEEPQVVVHVQAQVIPAVAQVGDPLDAHPEGEALVALGVEAAVL
jgi:hypothetical protein